MVPRSSYPHCQHAYSEWMAAAQLWMVNVNLPLWRPLKACLCLRLQDMVGVRLIGCNAYLVDVWKQKDYHRDRRDCNSGASLPLRVHCSVEGEDDNQSLSTLRRLTAARRIDSKYTWCVWKTIITELMCKSSTLSCLWVKGFIGSSFSRWGYDRRCNVISQSYLRIQIPGNVHRSSTRRKGIDFILAC